MDDEAIPILRVGNAAAAVTWYQRLGFTQEWEHRFEPGFPAFVSIARGRSTFATPMATGCASAHQRTPSRPRNTLSNP